MDKLIRVVIADSDTSFSKRLQTYLDQQADIKIIDTVREGQSAVNSCKDAWPDLLLLDLHLPVLDSVRAIQLILNQNERVRILGISNIPNDRYAVEAIKAGAQGYIERNGSDDFESIASAIRQIAVGEVILNPTLATSILQEFNK